MSSDTFGYSEKHPRKHRVFNWKDIVLHK